MYYGDLKTTRKIRNLETLKRMISKKIFEPTVANFKRRIEQIKVSKGTKVGLNLKKKLQDG